MASSSIGNPVEAAPHKVWTFLIRGGQEFEMVMPRTPKLDHPGKGMTMWKMVGSRRIAESLKDVLSEMGCEVELHTEGHTAEQEDLRAQRLGL